MTPKPIYHKPRILFISTAKTIGGGEVYLTNLIPSLGKKFECTVLGLPPVLELLSNSATTHRITLFPMWLEKALKRSYRLKKIYYRAYFKHYFKKHHYDIINLQEFDGAFVEAINFKPIVLTEQTRLFVPDNLRVWAGALLEKIDKVICVSTQTKNDIKALGVPGSKCVVVHSGIDTKKFKPATVAGSYVTWIGRMEEIDKNPMLFVKIAEAAQTKGLKYKFRMVGDGSAMKKLKNYIDDHGINNIELAGSRLPSEMLDVYHQASLVCMTSKTEGLPYTVVEAMACGNPVVASNVGGLGEIINSSEVGILIDGFEANHYLGAISSTLDNPKLYSRMALAARRRVETDFSIGKMTERTIRLYEETLK